VQDSSSTRKRLGAIDDVDEVDDVKGEMRAMCLVQRQYADSVLIFILEGRDIELRPVRRGGVDAGVGRPLRRNDRWSVLAPCSLRERASLGVSRRRHRPASGVPPASVADEANRLYAAAGVTSSDPGTFVEQVARLLTSAYRSWIAVPSFQPQHRTVCV
jgi:hypothetical protein